MVDWSKVLGKEVWKIIAYTLWMNGKIERVGREILDKARTIVIDKKIPKRL